MAEKEAAKTGPRIIIIIKSRKATTKKKAGRQHNTTLHSTYCPRALWRSLEEKKKKRVMWNNNPGIKVRPLLCRNTSRVIYYIVTRNKLTYLL